MAAPSTPTIAAFLLVLLGSLALSNAAPGTPIQPPPGAIICDWHVPNKELICDGKIYLYEPQDVIGSVHWWMDMGVVGLLIVGAGMASGLTIGLIGLDYTKLEVLSRSGTPREQAAARLILPIVSNHHLLLVTLLLATSSAEEALPIFLERMMPAWASIVVSVFVVLIFCEVLPMAICTRYGLEVGSKLSWLVNVLIVLCYPIAWPISKMLDWMFGHNAASLFKRSQLKELINMHSKHSIQTAEDVEAELAKLPVEDRLTSHEVQLIKNALDLNSRLCIEISTPIDEVYMLESSQVCDREVIGSIVHFGLHFCVPVYHENRDNVIGVIRVGDLISLSPDDNKAISQLGLDPIPKFPSDTPVYHAMTHLQSQQSQIALLVDPQLPRIPVAVLTMEDIIEELVAGQIQDMPIFPTSREGGNVLGEWMGPTDEEMRQMQHLETGSKASNSNFSTISLPVRRRPSYPDHTPTTPSQPLMGSQAVIDQALLQAKQPIVGKPAEKFVSFSPARAKPEHQHAPMLGQLPHHQHRTIQELDRAVELDLRLQEQEDENDFKPPPLQPSASWNNLPPRKLVPATPADFETSSVASDVTSTSYASSASSSSFGSQSAFSVASVGPNFAPGRRRRANSQTFDDYIADSGSEASFKTSAGLPQIRVEKKPKKKDPTTAHRIEKKLNVANVVATALKRSSSNISAGSSGTLPVIYKRNVLGDPVVDPSKLLSASYGDLSDIPGINVPNPPRPLSASYDALPPLDEEQVQLDW